MAGVPLTTVAEAEVPPLTLRRIEGEAVPSPVNGMFRGDVGSELAMVREPVRDPVAVGEKRMEMAQLAPGASVVDEQDVAMA